MVLLGGGTEGETETPRGRHKTDKRGLIGRSFEFTGAACAEQDLMAWGRLGANVRLRRPFTTKAAADASTQQLRPINHRHRLTTAAAATPHKRPRNAKYIPRVFFVPADVLKPCCTKSNKGSYNLLLPLAILTPAGAPISHSYKNQDTSFRVLSQKGYNSFRVVDSFFFLKLLQSLGSD